MLQIQRNLASEGSTEEMQKVVFVPNDKAKVGASLGYTVRTLLKDLGLEVRCCPLLLHYTLGFQLYLGFQTLKSHPNRLVSLCIFDRTDIKQKDRLCLCTDNPIKFGQIESHQEWNGKEDLMAPNINHVPDDCCLQAS